MAPQKSAEVKDRGTLPSGTITFLFTDIEGSSQRWESHPDAMQAAVARHEQLLAAAIARYGGHIFKTVGDAFCAAFPTAPGAVRAALDAQAELAKEDFNSVDGLRVRMGLHTGHAEERDADYFGPAVNRVARLMSIGHGGQVLVSDATKTLAQADLPPNVVLVDMGSHRLKDLAEPEHIWQLAADGLTEEFPALRSLDAVPNNLPLHITSFRGRERDLAEVASLLEDHRLLTIAGAGGVGKTRLALHYAADVLERYPDGIWFVDLAPLSDPELVSSVVARALGIRQPEGRRVDEMIPQWLRRKKLLLILDNCEHVLDIVAVLASAILTVAPDVRILATSRQPLGVGGESVYRLPSLSLPEAADEQSAERALAFGAVALFVDRAQAADGHFRLTDDSAPIVSEICRHLDGIPLAIELAAARVKVLSIPHLAHRLDERFRILTGGSRTVMPRQRTLIALIDWSYDLLTSQEQEFFRRLAIFAGGCGLDDVAAVCAGGDITEGDVLDLLSSLTDKSLVVADSTGDRERFRLLESTRAYALEKLIAAGERDAIARRHSQHFRDEAQAADLSYGKHTVAWLARVELELDNFRAALEWGLTSGHDAALAGAVAGALERLWFAGGLAAEGRYWIGRAQADLDESAQPQVAARLWRALSLLSSGKRKYDCAQKALAIFQSIADKRGEAWALLNVAEGLFQMGQLGEAKEATVRALAAFRECGEEWGAAVCLGCQANIDRYLDVDAGRELYADALRAFRALKDDSGTASALANLAELEFAEGHVELALTLVGESLDIHARGKNSAYLAIGFGNTAAYRIASGDVDGATAAARQGLRWARQAQTAVGLLIALQHLALLEALRGRLPRAAQLGGYVDAQFTGLGLQRESTETWGYDKLKRLLRERLHEDEIERLCAEGAAWSEDQAVEEALTL